MSEARNIDLNTTNSYKVNSVPCRIRYTGEHPTVSKYLIKAEENNETITYLRGRKLHGKEIELKGHILTKDNVSDDLKSVGKVESITYFEREGVPVEKIDRINEFVQLSELIHG